MKPSGVDWIGSIPLNWSLKRVKVLLAESSVKGFPNETLLAATQKQGVIPKTMVGWRTVEAKQEGRENFKLVTPDMFVISLRSFEGGIEHSSYRGIISSAYTVLSLSLNMHVYYFKYLLKSHAFIGGLQVHKQGIREGQSISYSEWSKDELAIPCHGEQIAIAAYLDDRTATIDSKIQLLQEKSTALSDLRKSVIHQAVTKGLDLNVVMKPSGVDWIGDIPAYWVRKRIKDMSPVTSGKMLTTQKSESNCVELPYYKTSNLTQDTEFQKMWYSMEEVNHLLIYQGDVLVAEGGAVGFPKYIGAAPAEATSFQNHVYRLRTASAHSKWLYYFLLATYTAQVYAAYSKAVTIANLNSYTLKNIAVVEPLREEQQGIATYLDARTAVIDDSIKTITEQITALKSLRQSLIHEAVTGKINVADFGYKTT